MKNTSCLALFLFPLLIFGQKVKLKKDKILFDGVEVAIMDAKGNSYSFSYLSGEKAFDAEFYGEEPYKYADFQWVELTSAEGVKTEIPYEILKTSFSAKKIMIQLLSEKYKLFDLNGMNKTNIAAFFSEEREKLSAKYGGAIAEKEAYEDKRKAVMRSVNPFVKEDGTILFGGFQSTNIQGRVNFLTSGKYYSITDLDGITVADAKSKSQVSTVVNITTYTDESFSLDNGSRTMMSHRYERSFAQMLVEELLVRGYRFGHEAKKYGKELRNAKIAVAKGQSDNLYGVEGFVIDEDGKKYEGTVYAIFEKLDLNPGSQQPGYAEANSIDKFGKFVSVKYKNEKGRERTKKFSARSKVQFCAVVDGEELCFYGMKTKGNALKKFENATNFGFDNSYFYQLEYANGRQMLLSKPGEPNTYILKFHDKKEGFLIDDRKNAKLSAALAEYISSCSSLSQDIAGEQFNLSEFENLKQIIAEYAECK